MRLQFININNQQVLDYVKYTLSLTGSESIPTFRFYSMFDFGIPLPGLEPLPNALQTLSFANSFVDDGYTVEFDKVYAYQLLYHEPSFLDLMKILMTVENSNVVNVLTNHSNHIVESIVDSLMKFIQERYALQSYLVNDVFDIDNLATSTFVTQAGYMNYLEDAKRASKYFDPKALLRESENYY